MEVIFGVVSETHELIFSGKPAGHGWLLGILVGLFYVTGLYAIWGLLMAAVRQDIWNFIQPVERICKYAGIVAGCIIPILAILIVYEVIMRYAFRAPTSWAFEISYMMMGTSLMLGIAYCTQLRRHIRVDFFYDNVSDKKKAAIDLAGFVFFLLPVITWIAWGLFVYFLEAYKVNEQSGESAWNPLIWPFKFTFTFGFYLFTLQTLCEAIKCILVIADREVPEPELPGGFE
jgi:TRAP-type mannitol/chloroaromatic compound transport system permease small subunit